MSNSHKYDIFISYAEVDRAWVEGYLLDVLRASSLRIITEASFTIGAPRLREFERAVTSSQRTLLVLSPAYLADDIQQFVEILGQTQDLESGSWRVIPIILHPVDLPLRLRSLVSLDAMTPEAQELSMQRLLATLAIPEIVAAKKPDCPFPGMVPFTENAAPRFFGRDSEIQDAVQHLRLSPFLAIIGSSGVGKSSLVFAGILPALRSRGWFETTGFVSRTMRPGPAPYSTLQGILSSLEDGNSRPLLLVVDQFEEVYTLGQTEAEAFQAQLLELFNTPDTNVLLTVRADFYQDLMASPIWDQIQRNRMEIAPLDVAGLRAAIEKPAQTAGVYIEPVLIDRLIRDGASEPGALPLVQETLVLLWDRLERRYLSLRTYQALASGSDRTGLQVAIARRADAAFAQLSPGEQQVARRVFLRLVHFGEGRAETRRQQVFGALQDPGDPPGRLDTVLDCLVERRILTTSGAESGEPRLDIAHEALIAGWPQLQAWIVSRREAEQTRRRLESKALEWDRLGRGTGGLLDDYEVKEASIWLESHDAADLGSSQNLRDLLEHSRRALAKSRRNRTFTMATIAVLLLGIFSTIILAQAFVSREQESAQQTSQAQILALETANALADQNLDLANTALAEADASRADAVEQASTARSRELAAESLVRGSNFLDVALLLAVEAHREKDTFQSRHALLTQLAAYPGLSQLLYNPEVINDYSPLYDFQFSPDGSLLAYGVDEQTILVDVNTGDQLVILPETAEVILFHPDNQRLILVNDSNVVSFWEIKTGQMLWSVENGSRWVTWTPEGAELALLFCADDGNRTCSVDRIVQWNLVSGRQTISETGLRGAQALNFQIDEDGLPELFDCTQADGGRCEKGEYVKLLDSGSVLTRTVPNLAIAGLDADLGGLDESWDRLLYFDADPNRFVIWDIASEQMLHEVPVEVSLDPGFIAISWTPDLTKAFLADRSSWLFGFDMVSGDLVHSSAAGLYGYPITRLRASPDGDTVALYRPTSASVSFSGENLSLFHLNTRFLEKRLTGHESRVISLAVNPQNGMLASGAEDGSIHFWDPQDVFSRSEISLEMNGRVTGLIYTPDGRFLVGVDAEGTVIFWDAETFREFDRFSTNLVASYTSLAASPDGRFLAAGGSGPAYGRIVWWDLLDLSMNEMELDQLPRYAEPLGMAFSADAEYLYMADYQGWLTYLNFPQLDVFLEPVEEASLPVTGLVYDRSRDIVLASSGSQVPIFDSHTGDDNGQPLQGDNYFTNIDLSPDGRTLAAILGRGPFDADAGISLWDLELRQQVGLIGVSEEEIGGFPRILYSRDGKWVIVSNWIDHSIRLFSTEPADWAAAACRIAGRNLTQLEWSTFFPSEAYRATCKQWPLGE